MRAAALGALERLGVATDGDVTGGLADADPLVRRRAATIAARHPGVDLLEAALADPDPSVVEVAAWACGERPGVDDVIIDRLIELATAAERRSARARVERRRPRRDRRRARPRRDPRGDRPTSRRSAAAPCSPWRRSSTRDIPAPTRSTRRCSAPSTDRDWQVRQAAEDLIDSRAGGACAARPQTTLDTRT